MPFDIALAFDPNTRACDLVFTGTDLAIDETGLTPLLVSMLSDRRAAPDDALPSGVTNDAAPLFNPRRGWPGDALDAQGRRRGSRLWLLNRDKQTDDTLTRAQDYASEAIGWIDDALGLPTSVQVGYPADGTLEIVAAAGPFSVARNIPVGG